MVKHFADVDGLDIVARNDYCESNRCEIVS